MKQINKKRIGTKISFFILVLAIIILSGCGSQGPTGFQNIDYHTGTDGLIVKFLDQAPPEEIYEETEFDVQIYIENKGAFDLIDGYRATAHLKYDNSVIMPITDQFLGQGLYSNKNKINLYGKSYYFPNGEENFFALDRFYTLPIQGNFERNEFSLYLSMCYPYKTFFADEICIDTDPNEISPREKICTSEIKSYSGGQGAPIMVSQIETQMVPKGVYIQPQFVIRLSHVGEGSFALTELEADETGDLACGQVNIDDVGKVEVEARLGLDKLECKPEEIIFKDNEAEIYCNLPDQSITGVSSNYLTTMSVEIDYSYMENFKKDISVVRSGGTLFSREQEPKTDWQCYPWEIFVEGYENDCVDKCEYCSTHTGVDECKINDLKQGEEIPKSLSLNHACVYRTSSDCIEAGDDCILQSGFCKTGTYCGIPQCYGSGNAKPSISVNQNSAEDQIQFFCYDQDDVMDSKRTCGCEETASYIFIDKEDSISCNEISSQDYNVLTNGFYNSANGRMEYSLYLIDINPDSDLCLRVEDKTGASSYKRLNYPWR